MTQMNVLLVDDETEFVTTLAERLELRGMTVRTASDGEAALPMVDDHPPDIIVLDLMMPGIGGIETLKRIKSTHPGIPVILLTGRGSTKEGIDGMRLGAFDYMMKPIDLDQLLEKLEEAAGKGDD
jgi:DNA-binding response OmpR family regulator